MRLSYLQVARVESISVASSPRPAPVNEAGLIRAAQRQDHEAFEQLVRQYDHNVLRVAMNLLRSQEDARDAYQEVFLRVYLNLDNFNFRSSFHTWLYRIVTNVCLDSLRRKRVRKDQAADNRADFAGANMVDRAKDDRTESNPDLTLSRRELAERIDQALGVLSPKERVVFELKHYEGLRLRTIGEMLSISEEAAKNCLFRATRKLRTALEDVRR